jgi:hypothetical protein
VNVVILSLALGALPAFGGGREARVAPVTLYTQFQEEPSGPLLEAMQDELETIMSPAGLHFDWHALADAGGRVSSQLAVIHFKGGCDVDNLRADPGFPGPLGWTHISDGEILPFIDVNCDGLRLFVQRELIEVPVAGRQEVFGRAMARVLAHELYHLLAHTKAHMSTGIAKAAYSVRELLSQKLLFGKKECESLRSHTVRLAPEPLAEGQ